MIFHAKQIGDSTELSYHEDEDCECSGMKFHSYENFLQWFSLQQTQKLTKVQHQFSAGIIGLGWGTEGRSPRHRKYKVKTWNKDLKETRVLKAEDIAAYDWLYEAVGVAPGDFEAVLGKDVDSPIFEHFKKYELNTKKLTDEELLAFSKEALINYVVSTALRSNAFISHSTYLTQATFNSIKRRNGGLAQNGKSETILKLGELMNKTKSNLVRRLIDESWQLELIKSHKGRFVVSDRPVLLLNQTGKLLPSWAFEPAAAIYVPLNSSLYAFFHRKNFRTKLDQTVLNQMQAFQAEKWIINTLEGKIKPFESKRHLEKQVWSTISTVTYRNRDFKLHYVPDWPRNEDGYIDLKANRDVYNQYIAFAGTDIKKFVTELYGSKVLY